MTAVTPKSLTELVAEARELTDRARWLADYARTGFVGEAASEVRSTALSAFEKLDEVDRVLTRIAETVASSGEPEDYAAGWNDRSRATATQDPETVALAAEHLRAARFRDRPSGRPIADTVFGHDDFTRRAAALLSSLPHAPENPIR